uniref:Uncharacterized protein n=1 Tax=Oncorhynchus mykiss TaxID=8022 RepID=A0A8C7RCT8_ONCMY
MPLNFNRLPGNILVLLFHVENCWVHIQVARPDSTLLWSCLVQGVQKTAEAL